MLPGGVGRTLPKGLLGRVCIAGPGSVGGQMLHRLRRSLTRAQLCLSCAATILVASPGWSQGTATLSGVVTDTDDLALVGVVVSVANTSLAARTDDRGEFRITGLPAGSLEVTARRLGFSPQTRVVDPAVAENGRIHFRLEALPALLDQVHVERKPIRYTGRLAGYYQRLERRSGGQFITRADIDRDESRTLSQLISSSPGMNRVALRSGGGAVRMRGRFCRPLVWIDGVPMPAGEVDLDAFPLYTLHGVEMYLGGTTAPLEYTAQGNRSSCGSILLWSRGRDTEGDRRSSHPPVDLEKLVSSMSVYTAEQVDRRAELKSLDRLQAAYPPELYANKISGSLTAEFVVDATGRVERETFTVVSTTHPLLAPAVSRALRESTFVPALKEGKAVRQYVRQRFDYGPQSPSLSSSR